MPIPNCSSGTLPPTPCSKRRRRETGVGIGTLGKANGALLRFTKLRVTGFKSFVDHVELLIEPGLTGIVGPNGCGKSNLIEALRWVMGETSAKQMRGGEMDDVIFAGSVERPSRNVAEVMLELDNGARAA